MCEHQNFDAKVRVARIEDKGRFMAEIRITCLDCGTPMQFMGLKPGLDFNGATVSLDVFLLALLVYVGVQQLEGTLVTPMVQRHLAGKPPAAFDVPAHAATQAAAAPTSRVSR